MRATNANQTTPVASDGLTITMYVDRAGFSLGDSVQGTLTVCPLVAVNIARISMELVCQCQAELCEIVILRDRSHHADRERNTFLSYSAEPLHTLAVDVHDTRAQGGSVFTVPCSVPFTFPLTMVDVPSTLKMVKGRLHLTGVKYYFIINAFSPFGQVVHTAQCEVNVYNAYAYPDPEKPLLSSANMRSTFFCCLERNKSVVYCATNKTVYCPGDQVLLSYWYQTDRPSTMPKLTLSVEMRVCTNQAHTPGTNFVGGTPHPLRQNTLLLNQSVAMPAQADTVCQASVTLPQDCGPEHSNDLRVVFPLTWKYEFCLKITLSSVSDRMTKIYLPIVINGKNAEQLVVNRPFRSVALPAATLAAQQLYINTAASTMPSALAAASGTSVAAGAAAAVGDVDANNFSTNAASYVAVPVMELKS